MAQKKRIQLKRYLTGFSIMFVISAILFILALIWQDDTSLQAIGDALWLVLILEFFVGWVMFVYNKNIFSPLVHSTKSLFLMFAGKKPKFDYYNYMKNIEENPIPNYIYSIVFLWTLILLIPTLAILFIIIS
jgi:hypothetical protein